MRLFLPVLTAPFFAPISGALKRKSFLLLTAATLGPALSAQSGSVAFSMQSLDEVTSLPAPYSDFASKLYVYPIGSTGATPSMLFLRDFNVHIEAADADVEDSKPVYTLISEYLGLSYDGAGNLDPITENGLIAMQIPVGETNETVRTGGNGIAGFIRTTQNPSTLGATSAPGYFDGLSGTMSWNYQAAQRVVRIEATGANYDPTFAFGGFATFNHTNETATITDLDFAISNASSGQWNFTTSNLRLDPDPTGTATDFTFRGSIQLDGLPSDDALPALPDPATANLESFQYDYYLVELVDDRDFDGDGIPDFVDLTGFAKPNALAKPNHASIQLNDTNWFYSPFFDAWFWSTTSAGNWDYSMTLGWLYDPTTGGVFDPTSFWFYLNTPSGNASNYGWLWTSEAVQPWYYRSADGAWLELRSSNPGSQSTFYNLSTDAEETLHF